MKWRPLLQAWLSHDHERTLAELGFDGGTAWRNNNYQVLRREEDTEEFGVIVHLSIRRLDRKPARDWRDFQRIKNQLCGEEWEGIEIYPAESRLVDYANQYHMWCFPHKLPFGYHSGRHVGNSAMAAAVGAKQREPDPQP